ncbi:MAG: Lipopolysaccharide heptosyltransferase [Gammaproteobacteria bacterium]|nr:Lipopolysaccharide heptosyltransferase [Gammaproteobacteria bacterium]
MTLTRAVGATGVRERIGSPGQLEAEQHRRDSTPDAQRVASTLNGWQRARIYVRLALRGLRHKSRRILGLALGRLVGSRHYATTLHPGEVTTVLICRINGRLGNTMFLTPLIRSLHELLPHAAIDLVLAHPKAKDLLGDLPGVRRIIVLPHKTPKIWLYLAALRDLRACRYDLAVDPTPESTSGRAALTLCRARYRVGFATVSQWAPLTHAVPEPQEIENAHQAVRPVFLVCRIFAIPYEPQSIRLWLPLREDEVAAGRQAIARATGSDCDAVANVFGFFAHAATFKVIDQAWWLAFWEMFLALEPQAIPLEFLPLQGHAPMAARFPSLHVPSPRGLTAAIAATRMFISTDTGPMHLGSSTAVPTVVLFHASNLALYRPLKPNDLAIDITQCSPHAVAYRCQRIWRRPTAWHEC